MPILIAMPMYPVSEVCKKLAERTGFAGIYTRQQINAWIKKKLPTAQKVGNKYFLSEAEISWLAGTVHIKKRRKNIDKRQ